MKGKKGDISPIYFIIAGILMFIIVSCTMGQGVMKAFKTTKNTEKSFDEFTEAIAAVADKSNNLQLQLVRMEMEKGSAVYLFSGASDLIETRVEGQTKKRVIAKPSECDDDKLCVCLCKEVSYEKPDDLLLKELEAKYPSSSVLDVYYRELKCAKGITCKKIENVKLKEEINLEAVSPDKFAKNQYTTHTIYWEGGFSFSRPDDKSYADLVTMESPYADVYVIPNTDYNTISICFSPDCKDK